MVQKSQNGYSVDTELCASYTIPGTTERIVLRKGSAGVLLLDFLGFMDAEVEGLQQKILDEWGLAIRNVRGSSTSISNHASGTAADMNATRHPLGKINTFTSDQYAKIHSRLALYDGALRSGIDYHTRKDEMHIEINADPAVVVAVADKIRRGQLGHGARSYLVGRAPFAATKQTKVVQHPHSVVKNPYAKPKVPPFIRRNDKQRDPLASVKFVQWAIGLRSQDGYFGAHTEVTLQAFQHAHKLRPDGVVGPITLKVLLTIHR